MSILSLLAGSSAHRAGTWTHSGAFTRRRRHKDAVNRRFFKVMSRTAISNARKNGTPYQS